MNLLLIHAAATLFMTGLIWFVQVVHYPLMAKVSPDGYPAFQVAHERLTTWVVGPPMLIELLCTVWLVIAIPKGLSPWLAVAGLSLLVLIWLSTMFLQVPQHRILEGGFIDSAHHKLVRTNWLRTIAWTLRSALALYMISLINK